MTVDPYKDGNVDEQFQLWLDRLTQRINIANWQTPTLLNSWADAAGYQGARFRKNILSQVHIQGRIDSGTATPGTTLFTLPAQFRPAAKLAFDVHSNGLLGLVEVESDGDVIIQIGSNVSLDLTGINFLAEL